MKYHFFTPKGNNDVLCTLCHHKCVIKDGKRGICNVRENQAGQLISLVHGHLISQSVDPIEKKPVFHLAPGSLSYSIATVGCNLRCQFCQNASIAQLPTDHGGRIIGEPATPSGVVTQALKNKCKSIAYTYTEPTIFFEFALETAQLAHEQGIQNVFVSNGYMTPLAIEAIAPFLDAANIDLKAFNDKFYHKYCGASLAPVKETLKQMVHKGILVEVTTLLIPGLNDDAKELKSLADFLVAELGPATPWHISRFYPTYRMTDRPPTDVGKLLKARDIGYQAGLHYVYIGNVPGNDGESTFCHQCGHLLIHRIGYRIDTIHIKNQSCMNCGTPVAGVDLP